MLLSVGILCVVRDWFWGSGFVWPLHHALGPCVRLCFFYSFDCSAHILLKYGKILKILERLGGTVWSELGTQRI